jgi:hypothetical protein
MKQLIVPIMAMCLAGATFQLAAAQNGSDNAQQDAEQATSGKNTEQDGVIPPPRAGKGQVVIFRLKNLYAMLEGCKVYESGALVVKLGNGKYFVKELDPGTYEFNNSPNAYGDNLTTVEIKAGGTAYIKCSLGMGDYSSYSVVGPAYKANFDEHARKLKPMK